jgi:damage-control phosphatase, subfamily II, stand-alone protein
MGGRTRGRRNERGMKSFDPRVFEGPAQGQKHAFRKLADPAGYVACSWDLTEDEKGRNHWVPFFKRHLNTILKLGVEAAAARGAAEAEVLRRADGCRAEFYAAFDAYFADPRAFGRVTILTLDRWRDGFLRKWGFIDSFIDFKDRENEKMLPLLPAVCREVDSLAEEEQLWVLIHGIFAGNIFDMGADATAKAFLAGGPDFFATRKSITPRPWLIDDYDALRARLLGSPRHRKVVFFVDNAGSDFLLGALPLMRWFAQRGTSVVLAANERPTLNDMTLADVENWWPKVVAVEPSFEGLGIERISSGTGEPLIDLSDINPALNVAAADADLLILEGMGRGVESNLEAEFSCDALNIAMIKDTSIAERHRGKLYDVVCQFRGKSL